MPRGLREIVICVVVASLVTLIAGCGGGKGLTPSVSGLTEETRPSPALSSDAEAGKLARGGKGSKGGGKGKVNVTSTPSGGRVFLNGQDTGKVTPTLLTNVPAGTATVTVRKEGYQDFTQPVQVQSKKTANVAAQLVPAPPVITVHSLAPSPSPRFDCTYVVVIAEVTTVSVVGNVTARIVRQQDGQHLPDMALQRIGTTNIYHGVIVPPPNTRSDGQSETYAVTVVATDTGGRQSEKVAGNFAVPAPSSAPGGPSLSRTLR